MDRPVSELLQDQEFVQVEITEDLYTSGLRGSLRRAAYERELEQRVAELDALSKCTWCGEVCPHPMH